MATPAGPPAPLPPRLVAVITTVDDEAVADRLARAAVAERLAACVQVEAVRSTYRWQGAVEQAAEWRLLFKTAADRQAALVARLLALHPYDLPAVFTIDVTDATPAYARWVHDETRGASG